MFKRKLTSQEIQECLNFVLLRKSIPYDIAITQQENIQQNLRKQLEGIEIYPSQIQKLKETIERKFLTTQISAGSMVGALAATSIGEPMTQLVLNSFHSSGISKSNVTTGVPRMKELLNVSSVNKMCGMKLFFKDCDHTDVVQLRDICKEHIEHVSTNDIIESKTITLVSKLPELDQYKNIAKEDWEDWHEYHSLMISDEYKSCSYCIIFKINKEKLYGIKKTLLDICDYIDSVNEDLHSVASDEEHSLVITYVNVPELQSIDNLVKKFYKDKDDDLVGNSFINDENKSYYYIRDIVLPDILDLTISGVENVSECFFDQPPGSSLVNGKRSWVVNTRGSNFRDILNNPYIDHTRTMTSRLHEIENVLGIEAARSFLISEFSAIISSSKRHIEQLVNAMTFTGKVCPANRHGIKNSVGVMAKMSFEQPLKHAIQAAVSNEKDSLQGISGQLMLGKFSKVGTGYMSVVYKAPEVTLSKSLIPEKQENKSSDNPYYMKWVKGKGFIKVLREESKTPETKIVKPVNKKRTIVGGEKIKKTFTGFDVQEKNIFKTSSIKEKKPNYEAKYKENKQVLSEKREQPTTMISF